MANTDFRGSAKIDILCLRRTCPDREEAVRAGGCDSERRERRIIAKMNVDSTGDGSASLARTRLRRSIFQRQTGGEPTVRSLAIPRDIRIAEGVRTLGGVPGHPAIRQ